MYPQMIQTTITEKQRLSHNVFKLVLKFQTELIYEQSSFFIYIFSNDERKRPYTPIEYSQNQMTIIIKYYQTNGVADYICSLNIGDALMISPPIYKLPFKDFDNVLMLAGGTGIAPILQIINSNKKNKYKIIWSNSTVEDIILLHELNKTNVTVHHIVSKETNKETNSKSERILKEIGNEKFSFVFCCGTDSYLEDVCGGKTKDKKQGELKGILKELGYSESEVYKF